MHQSRSKTATASDLTSTRSTASEASETAAVPTATPTPSLPAPAASGHPQATTAAITKPGALEDNAAARDLVTLLPVTVAMGDLFGREKPGPLPRALTGDVEPDFTYRVGQIAYWPPGRDIFVVYDGGGLRVPSPGLIELGTVDSGLDVIAEAG